MKFSLFDNFVVMANALNWDGLWLMTYGLWPMTYDMHQSFAQQQFQTFLQYMFSLFHLCYKNKGASINYYY